MLIRMGRHLCSRSGANAKCNLLKLVKRIWGEVFGKESSFGGATVFRKAAVSAVHETNKDLRRFSELNGPQQVNNRPLLFAEK